MLPGCRRVVTVNDQEGRSRIMLDGPTPHTLETRPGRGLIDFWRTDAEPGQNGRPGDAAAVRVTIDPPAKGSVFRFFQVAPESASAHLSLEERLAAAAEVFAKMGGSHSLVDTRRHPGMHKTHTTDYIVLLKGRVRLLLDDAETDLEPFDVVVQRGTNHAWVNLGEEPALLVAVLVDDR
jgi:mannose-6-phosphate isomerase-like protein (cupin superfamily)